MKPKYFSGYVTYGNRFQNPDYLEVGKKYLVKEVSGWVERNGNGGSTSSSWEHWYEVYSLDEKLLSENQRQSVFKEEPKQNCDHDNSAFLDDDKKIQQCQDCFIKFRVKTFKVIENEQVKP